MVQWHGQITFRSVACQEQVCRFEINCLLEFSNGLCLNLPDSFTGNFENMPDFFQGVRKSVSAKAKSEFDYFALTERQFVKSGFDFFCQQFLSLGFDRGIDWGRKSQSPFGLVGQPSHIYQSMDRSRFFQIQPVFRFNKFRPDVFCRLSCQLDKFSFNLPEPFCRETRRCPHVHPAIEFL